jgi:hypothetical protein
MSIAGVHETYTVPPASNADTLGTLPGIKYLPWAITLYWAQVPVLPILLIVATLITYSRPSLSVADL